MRQDLALLRDRRFDLLLAARTCSVLGNAFGPVALAFGVLALPGATPTTLSVVVAAEALSTVAFILLGGVIADRFPRFIVMVVADLAAAAAWGGLAAMLITGWAPVPMLVAVSALAGMAGAVFYPAFTGVVPEVIAAERLQTANGFLRLGMNAARILGYALAGTAVAVLGAGWAMSLNAGLLVASAAFIAFLRLPRASRSESGNMLRELRDGWMEFRSREWLWVVVLQYSFVIMVLQGVWAVLGPVVANDRLGGPRGWSVVLAAEAIGMVVGVVFAMRIKPRRPVRLVVLLTFPLAGLPLALGTGASLVVVALVGFVNGVAVDLLMVLWDTTMQREIPADMLSRVSAYDALGSISLGPLGLLLAGPAAALFGVNTAAMVCAAVVVISTFGALASRGVRQLEWSSRAQAEPSSQPTETAINPTASVAPTLIEA